MFPPRGIELDLMGSGMYLLIIERVEIIKITKYIYLQFQVSCFVQGTKVSKLFR